MTYSFIGYLPNITKTYNVSTTAMLTNISPNVLKGYFKQYCHDSIFALSGKGKALLEARCKQRLIEKAKTLDKNINGIININYSFSYNNYCTAYSTRTAVSLFATGAAVILK